MQYFIVLILAILTITQTVIYINPDKQRKSSKSSVLTWCYIVAITVILISTLYLVITIFSSTLNFIRI